MSNGVNKATIVGHLGADVSVRYTPSGQAVADMRVATNRSWKDKTDTVKTATEWHRVVVWGKQAESCAKYLKKGRQVYIEGRLQTRNWKDQEGIQHWTTEIVAQTVQFLGSGGVSQPNLPSIDQSVETTTEDDIPMQHTIPIVAYQCPGQDNEKLPTLWRKMIKTGDRFRFSREFLEKHRQRFREAYTKCFATGLYDNYSKEDEFEITQVTANHNRGLIEISFFSKLTNREDRITIYLLFNEEELFNTNIFISILDYEGVKHRQLELPFTGEKK